LERLLPENDFLPIILDPNRAQLTGMKIEFKPSEPNPAFEIVFHRR
jgi:hypothetical protein